MANNLYLGSVNPSVPITVTAERGAGAKQILLNDVSQFPTGNFFFSVYRIRMINGVAYPDKDSILEGIGSVNAQQANCVDVVSLAPGYTDNGNHVGDIFLLKMNAQWANEVSSRLLGIDNKLDPTFSGSPAGMVDLINSNPANPLASSDQVKPITIPGKKFSDLQWKLLTSVIVKAECNDIDIPIPSDYDGHSGIIRLRLVVNGCFGSNLSTTLNNRVQIRIGDSGAAGNIHHYGFIDYNQSSGQFSVDRYDNWDGPNAVYSQMPSSPFSMDIELRKDGSGSWPRGYYNLYGGGWLNGNNSYAEGTFYYDTARLLDKFTLHSFYGDPNPPAIGVGTSIALYGKLF